MLEHHLPEEFKFLQFRKKQLQKELEQIEALQRNLIETRQLLDRAVSYIGSMTHEEFVNAPGGRYMELFLAGKSGQAAHAAAMK